MPTYEFECEKCGNIQEETYSMKDVPKDTKCKKCGKIAKKIFSKTTGIVAEGSDFFTVDGKY